MATAYKKWLRPSTRNIQPQEVECDLLGYGTNLFPGGGITHASFTLLCPGLGTFRVQLTNEELKRIVDEHARQVAQYGKK